MNLAAELPGWRPCKAHGWIRWDSPSGMVALRLRRDLWSVTGGSPSLPPRALRYFDPALTHHRSDAIRLALRADRLLPLWAT